jgi:hypothetical protein
MKYFHIDRPRPPVPPPVGPGRLSCIRTVYPIDVIGFISIVILLLILWLSAIWDIWNKYCESW